MKNLKILALLGLGCCLLACSRQKASESPRSKSSDPSSKASSASQASSKAASSSQASTNQTSPSQSSASAESESSSQTTEKVREEETQPSSKEAPFSNQKTSGSSYADPASLEYLRTDLCQYDSSLQGRPG
ncbi:hypothetical protein I872_05795 [Streptococcus cristatus AS 1.3089]|uniref:Lipoprotein n=1 Tax=Streptococcus cristatus AS 1.3089 TaxID=1302863 RepID=A0ABM5NK74_STRCR|nr:hypothetical protein I872_05795 [Streptococcus cristatus AS 1.3089]